MATTRPAEASDIKGIAVLFNSDPDYHYPWLATPKLVKEYYDYLERQGLVAAKLVAVDEKEGIVGHIVSRRFHLTDSTSNDSKVAELNQGFVKPGNRKEGIASQLLDKVEAEITAAGHDFAMASAVCGHPNSQNLFISKGYMPTAFAPNSINASLTLASQRESLLYVVKAVSESGKASLGSHRQVYVPSEAQDVLAAAYSAACLSQLRDIAVNSNTSASDADRNWVEGRLRKQGGGNPELTLPLDTVDITNQKCVSMLKAYMESGYMPVGVLPIGTDRIILMYVPKGLVFDPSGVKMADKASSLAKIVSDSYNSKALAPQAGTSLRR